jgi:hypothetical protein
MQAPIHIRVPHVRDSLTAAKVCGVTSAGERSDQNRIVILSGATSAEKPALSEVEGKDLWLSSSLRRIC